MFRVTHSKPACGWDAYMKRAEQVSRRTVPKPRDTSNIHDFGNDRRDMWDGNRPDHRQCDFRGQSLGGRRCKKWAVRGASRCEVHGGLRQNPDHPANGRLWRKGKVQQHDKAKQARLTVRHHPMRASAVEMLRGAGIPATAINVLRAIDALEADDGGKSWRRLVRVASGKPKHLLGDLDKLL